LRADDERRPVLAPHRAVGADRHAGAQAVAVRVDEGAQARRADLLLALEEEDQADRRSPGELRERLGDRDRDEQIPLVVARPARVEAAVALGRLEWRGSPQVE